MQSELEEIPSRLPDELNEDIPGMEISNLDEPGFEVVTKVSIFYLQKQAIQPTW